MAKYWAFLLLTLHFPASVFIIRISSSNFWEFFLFLFLCVRVRVCLCVRHTGWFYNFQANTRLTNVFKISSILKHSISWGTLYNPASIKIYFNQMMCLSRENYNSTQIAIYLPGQINIFPWHLKLLIRLWHIMESALLSI